MSAGAQPRDSFSECGSRCSGGRGAAAAAGAGDRSGSAFSSVPGSSGPSWLAAVLYSHNQVAPVPLELPAGPGALGAICGEGCSSGTGEGGLAAGHKRVSE
jgi:hypothetical protein